MRKGRILETAYQQEQAVRELRRSAKNKQDQVYDNCKKGNNFMENTSAPKESRRKITT